MTKPLPSDEFADLLGDDIRGTASKRRDVFALVAMRSLIYVWKTTIEAPGLARRAYDIADEMLKERERWRAK